MALVDIVDNSFNKMQWLGNAKSGRNEESDGKTNGGGAGETTPSRTGKQEVKGGGYY